MTGPVPNAIYPADPYASGKMQKDPSTFKPPAFWGVYPPFSAGGQPTVINTANPALPWEDGPSYAPLGGQQIGLVNANPVSPIGK